MTSTLRRTFLALTLLSLVTGAVYCPRTVGARSARQKLRFTETFGDFRTRENVTQKGHLEIEVVMPLTGFSLKKVNGKTPFFLGLGNLTMAGTLADDPKYRPGKKSAHFRDRGRNLRMEWNRRRLLMTLTVETERGEPGAFAETYMPSPDGPIEGTAISFTSFGDRASRLDITYKGAKTTRNGLRKIRLSGGGNTECGCT
jgi:hypothetical protein